MRRGCVWISAMDVVVPLLFLLLSVLVVCQADEPAATSEKPSEDSEQEPEAKSFFAPHPHPLPYGGPPLGVPPGYVHNHPQQQQRPLPPQHRPQQYPQQQHRPQQQKPQQQRPQPQQYPQQQRPQPQHRPQQQTKPQQQRPQHPSQPTPPQNHPGPYPIPVSRPQKVTVPMNVLDTQVKCEKTQMRVSLRLSAPFHGYIYPYGQFHRCLMFQGEGQRAIELVMGHGECPGDLREPGLHQFDPVIQHRLMIQWDREIVEEWDNSVIVRCDRPADYEKTIKFDFGSLDKKKTLFAQATHKGPRMYMEIQRGEGPQAPPLDQPVVLGETLTLLLTLSEEVFDFDTNILDCWALDGGGETRQIEWVSAQSSHLGQRQYSGQMSVIENGCSVKPKIFGHFQKIRHEVANSKVTTQFAHFKAFRFPTSMKIVIQCNIQVCFRSCPRQSPCQESFQPRKQERTKREIEEEEEEEEKEERVALYRSIEVLLPEESVQELQVPSVSPPGVQHCAQLVSHTSAPLYAGLTHPNGSECSACEDCITSAAYFGTLFALGAVIVVLILMGIWLFWKRSVSPRGSAVTPHK